MQLGGDLLEGGLAEVADVQELFLVTADQMADGGNAFALQAVGRADGQLQMERHVVGQGAEDVVGVDDLYGLVVEDVGGGDHTPAVAIDPQCLVRLRVVLDHQQLDIQDQVGDVVDHAGDRGKLVLNTQ